MMKKWMCYAACCWVGWLADADVVTVDTLDALADLAHSVTHAKQ